MGRACTFRISSFSVIASNSSEAEKGSVEVFNETNGQDATSVSADIVLQPHCSSGRFARRRYGALVPDGKSTVGHHGGQGEQARLSSTDLHSCPEEVVEAIASFTSRDVPT